MFFKASFALFVVVIIAVTFVAVPRDEGQARPSDAEAAARHWIGDGSAQPARIEDDEWEVDVIRPDGSLVEVTFDHDLNLRDFDEELGIGGERAHDEVRGPLRDEAIETALRVTGPGSVTSVERDGPDELEVNVRVDDGSQVEVELDARLSVGEVEDEHPDDE
jgi:hypothetical protein